MPPRPTNSISFRFETLLHTNRKFYKITFICDSVLLCNSIVTFVSNNNTVNEHVVHNNSTTIQYITFIFSSIFRSPLRTDCSYLSHHTASTLGPDDVLSRNLAQLLLLVQQPVALVHSEFHAQASQRRHRHSRCADLAVDSGAVLGQRLQGHHGVLRSRKKEEEE